MTFQYLSVEDAMKRGGLRMVVLGGIPSPWSEAAKGLQHIKRIEWTAVRLVHDNAQLREWAGQRSTRTIWNCRSRYRSHVVDGEIERAN